MTAKTPLTLSIECDDCHVLVTLDKATPSRRVHCECQGATWHLAETKGVDGTRVERLGTMDDRSEAQP